MRKLKSISSSLIKELGYFDLEHILNQDEWLLYVESLKDQNYCEMLASEIAHEIGKAIKKALPK